MPRKPPQQPTSSQFSLQPPLSPRSASREKARVTVLLDINSALLQEVVNLQSAGKAGLPPNQHVGQQASPTTDPSTSSPTSATDPSNPQLNSPQDATKPTSSGSSKQPSEEFIACMRRLQANLAYLATIADRAKKAGGQPPKAPAIMDPPPHLASVNDLYVKMNELFPDATKTGTSTPMSQQQKRGSPQQQTNGGTLTGSVGEATT